MNTKFLEARECIAKAREALRSGDKATARRLGEQAALLVPGMEDAWLVLTASDPNPQDALAYAQKALELNPQSMRARKGVEWAKGRLKQAEGGSARVEPSAALTGEAVSKGRNDTIPIAVPRESKKAKLRAESKSRNRVLLYGVSFGVLVCIVFVVAAWSAVASPVFADILDAAPTPTQENLWAQVDIAKPSVTPIGASGFVQVATVTSAPVIVPPAATLEPALSPTDLPTSVPTEAPTFIPEVTETPGTVAMEIVPDMPTSQYVAPAVANEQPSYPATGNAERWIDVNLSEQRVYAYEGDMVVNSFVVSTGVAQTPTVTGRYKIYVKVRSQALSGPGYYLPDVPFVMFFYEGYGFHGTYWHNNFGTPMSRGCVNLTIPDSEWLYNWASVGTVVNVHY